MAEYLIIVSFFKTCANIEYIPINRNDLPPLPQPQPFAQNKTMNFKHVQALHCSAKAQKVLREWTVATPKLLSRY